MVVAKYQHRNPAAQAQEPDTAPEYYYVSVADGPRKGLLVGPFKDDHRRALDLVPKAREAAELCDSRSVFYAFGTCRADKHLGPGVLNGQLGIQIEASLGVE